jgi:hypothetical protein
MSPEMAGFQDTPPVEAGPELPPAIDVFVDLPLLARGRVREPAGAVGEGLEHANLFASRSPSG